VLRQLLDVLNLNVSRKELLDPNKQASKNYNVNVHLLEDLKMLENKLQELIHILFHALNHHVDVEKIQRLY